jgi:hypothetical protein
MNTPNSKNSRLNIPTSNPVVKIFGSIVFVVLALVALYYLYQYLFGKTTGSSVALARLNGPQKLTSGVGTTASSYSYANSASVTQFAPIVDGGQYSVSLWVYITSFAPNSPKPILSIGSNTPNGNDTLRIYLDSVSNVLHVRTGTASGEDRLFTAQRQTEYTNAGVTSGTPSCDIPNFEYQRWVHVTVILNTRTTDVFLDGKLARSCVNSGAFTVNPGAILQVNELVGTTPVPSGIDGYISNVVTYNYALAPDEVYRNYMQGPDATYSVWTYLLSFFNPKAYGEGVTGTYV